jgi:hypothetical protein
MDDLIEMLFEYVDLASRANARGAVDLSASERATLLALTQWIPGDGGAPSPREGDGDGGLAAQWTGPDGFEVGRIVAISRDGLRMRLTHPMRAGAATIVRVTSASLGAEFAFPCRVAWCDRRQMGLLFDGAPSRTALAATADVRWSRPLDLRTGWGRRPIVAAA